MGDVMGIWSLAAQGQGQGQAALDLVGFDVRTPDGSLGHVERQENEPGRQHLIVDTGVWLFGKSVLIPGGAVERVDAQERTVTVAFTKEQVKGAPQFATDHDTADPGYLGSVGSYYHQLVEEARAAGSAVAQH